MRWYSLSTLLAATLAGACTSARVSAPIEGEPVCADFVLGASQSAFKGALKQPVKITVLDGKSVVSERVVLGKRSASEPSSILVVEDDDESYVVRFAQCDDGFAPQPADAARDARQAEARTHYACGDATMYKEIDLKVISGDVASRAIVWQVPPNAACYGEKTPDLPPAP
ncbi:MAG: hypothetical protein EXR75_04165 [Myxococcales bacterium]|nr:hypothetical protein [Myxococcales bacterium]